MAEKEFPLCSHKFGSKSWIFVLFRYPKFPEFGWIKPGPTKSEKFNCIPVRV